ncbi:MAG TPA: DUF5916 domain-containing protein [Gemmatimonadaceae bacterium]|nr:DUF5916 domain-containing protein [Gemmatimonadaceae bacterium]
MLRRVLPLLPLLPLALPLAAQSVDPGVAPATPGAGVAIRATRAPVLDGRADDPVWGDAPVLDGFRQFQPAEDGEPSFRTEARVAYDERNLYVLVRAYDPHPDSIVSLLSRRDVRTNSDWIKVLVDAYHDRRSGVQFAVNPAGVKRDASIFNDVEEDLSWDGVWDAATAVDSLGWVAEFRIPFGQLRFSGRDRHTFGFGIWRDIARRNERVSWPLYRPTRNTLASQLGTVGGIGGISRGSRLELLPYTVAKDVSRRRADGWGHGREGAAGLDLKYAVSQSFTLDATVNPDFGQVEADPAVLNLTAFEIRFEERRPFFQEGFSLFRCNGPCEGIFYTRRIGRPPQLRAEGTEDATFTTILGAAKLTGRLRNGLSLGLVEAVTRREVGASGTTIEPRTSYLVGRAYKELRAGRSGAGLMVTAVNRDLDAATVDLLRREAYTGLFQGFHRFAGERYEVMGYVGATRVAGSAGAIAATQQSSVHLWQRPDHEREYDPTLTSMTGGVQAIQLRNLGGVVRWTSFLRNALPGTELNDLGFVPLVNDFSLRNFVTVQSRRPRWFYRSATLDIEEAQHWTAGGLLSQARALAVGTVELRNSSQLSTTYEGTNLAGAYCVACARGGPALRQSPRHALALAADGDPRRVLVPHVEVRYERGDGGRSTLRRLAGSVDLRVASRFSMSLGPEVEQRVDDAQWVANYGALGDDTTHYTFARLRQTTVSATARVSFTATPALSFQLYGQPFVSGGSFTEWRELATPRARSYAARFRPYGGGAVPEGFNVKEFRSNAVVRWEYRPGSALFVVWQQGRLQDDRNLGSFAFRRDYHDLFDVHPQNTLLVKASYWLTL